MTACNHCYGRSANDRCLNCGAYLPARAALAAAPLPENGDALSVLSGISSYLGAGMGDENTTPAEFEKRIRWGIDNHVSAIIALAADTVEHLSKRPNTTWGEVKSAIIALAAAPLPMGCGLPCGFDCNGACFDAAAPQSAPEDRVELLAVIHKACADADWRLQDMTCAIADALLARGLRLPGGGETMAWAVVGEDGKINPHWLGQNLAQMKVMAEEGERVVRVAIRVVEGGDDE